MEENINLSRLTVIEYLKNAGRELSVEEIEIGVARENTTTSNNKAKFTMSAELIGDLKANSFILSRVGPPIDPTSTKTQTTFFTFKTAYTFNNEQTLLEHLAVQPLNLTASELRSIAYEGGDSNTSKGKNNEKNGGFHRLTEDITKLEDRGRLYVLKPTKKLSVAFINAFPQYKPLPKDIREWWNVVDVIDMIEIRLQLTQKYKVALAKLPYDEDSHFASVIRARIAQQQDAKRKKGRGRIGRRTTNVQLDEIDVNINLGIAGQKEPYAQLLESLNKEGANLDSTNLRAGLPPVPEQTKEFIRKLSRAFLDGPRVVVLDAILAEVCAGTVIEERSPDKVGDKLGMQPKYVNCVLRQLKSDKLLEEITLTEKRSEISRYKKQYSCWLIGFNNFMDVVHYRLLKLLETMELEREGGDGTGSSMGATERRSEIKYCCPRKTCGRVYTLEHIALLFENENKCLLCGRECIDYENSAANKKISAERKQVVELLEILQKIIEGEKEKENDKGGKNYKRPTLAKTLSVTSGTSGKKNSLTGSKDSKTKISSKIKKEGTAMEIDAHEAEDVKVGMEIDEEELNYSRISIPNDEPRPLQFSRDGLTVYLPLASKDSKRKGPPPAALTAPDDDGGTATKRRKLDVGTWNWCPSVKEAHTFLATVATLKKYCSQVLEYEISPQSLYLAKHYWGIDGKEILEHLQRLAAPVVNQRDIYSGKWEVPENLTNLVEEFYDDYGNSEENAEINHQIRRTIMKDYFKGKLVLRGRKFYVESKELNILKRLRNSYTEEPKYEEREVREDYGFELLEEKLKKQENTETTTPTKPRETETIWLMEIRMTNTGGSDGATEVKRTAHSSGIPLIEEYDFIKDRWSKDPDAAQDLAICLKSTSRPRDYQRRAAHSLFWDNKVHSGILVLPCGAGKTLVGITVTSIVKKCCLIFCHSTMAANQWKEQFLHWADVEDTDISRFTASSRKDDEWDFNCGVLITTYAMFSSKTKRGEHSSRMIARCRERTWGLMILDEVHLAPADTFRKVTTEFRSHIKLGLTATMVREDNLIEDLPHLVGPQLGEVDLPVLRSNDHVSEVKCFHIKCPMVVSFKNEYDTAGSPELRRLLYITNPRKVRICLSILKYHLNKEHKVLVFCDDLFGLQWFSRLLQRDYIDGKTQHDTREKRLNSFRSAKGGAFIIISKVGDHSIDLPEANVVIQVGIVDGSRMQEAQRVGRIQRRGKKVSPISYFYAIISDGTDEVTYSEKRKQFMIDHGYVYVDEDYKQYEKEGDGTEQLMNIQLQEDLIKAAKNELLRRDSDRKEALAEGGKGRGRGTTKSAVKKKGTTRDRLKKQVNRRG